MEVKLFDKAFDATTGEYFLCVHKKKIEIQPEIIEEIVGFKPTVPYGVWCFIFTAPYKNNFLFKGAIAADEYDFWDHNATKSMKAFPLTQIQTEGYFTTTAVTEHAIFPRLFLLVFEFIMEGNDLYVKIRPSMPVKGITFCIKEKFMTGLEMRIANRLLEKEVEKYKEIFECVF